MYTWLWRIPWQNTVLVFVVWEKLWTNTTELLGSIISTMKLLIGKLKKKHSIFGNKFIILSV